MTLSVTEQLDTAWAEHKADTDHAEALAAEVAGIEAVTQVIADMDRLDGERDAELLQRAKHPGDTVVYLN